MSVSLKCEMDKNLRRSMFEYYGERAPEYDQVYAGGGPAAFGTPEDYARDVDILSRIVARVCVGELIDLGCGTAFWLPHYADICGRVTLVDQSEGMLAEALDRVAALGIADRTVSLQADVVDHDFGGTRFDCVLVGFLLSHLTSDQEARFLHKARQLVKPQGTMLILDSVWNEAHARIRTKEGIQYRNLSDGRRYEIYKKYFDEDELAAMGRAQGFSLTIEYFGPIYFAATGKIERG